MIKTDTIQKDFGYWPPGGINGAVCPGGTGPYGDSGSILLGGDTNQFVGIKPGTVEKDFGYGDAGHRDYYPTWPRPIDYTEYGG